MNGPSVIRSLKVFWHMPGMVPEEGFSRGCSGVFLVYLLSDFRGFCW